MYYFGPLLPIIFRFVCAGVIVYSDANVAFHSILRGGLLNFITSHSSVETSSELKKDKLKAMAPSTGKAHN